MQTHGIRDFVYSHSSTAQKYIKSEWMYVLVISNVSLYMNKRVIHALIHFLRIIVSSTAFSDRKLLSLRRASIGKIAFHCLLYSQKCPWLETRWTSWSYKILLSTKWYPLHWRQTVRSWTYEPCIPKIPDIRPFMHSTDCQQSRINQPMLQRPLQKNLARNNASADKMTLVEGFHSRSSIFFSSRVCFLCWTLADL